MQFVMGGQAPLVHPLAMVYLLRISSGCLVTWPACGSAGVSLLAKQLPICPRRSGSRFLSGNEEDGLPKMGTATGPAQPCPLLPAAHHPV